MAEAVSGKGLTSGLSPVKHKTQTIAMNALTWTEKYSPKVPKDIIGNESLVCVLVLIFLPLLLELNLYFHVSKSGKIIARIPLSNYVQVDRLQKWLANWNAQFLDNGNKKNSKKNQSKIEEEKCKKPNNSAAKKAVLISGTPGIGKTTSAKLVSQMLGFQAIEVA